MSKAQLLPDQRTAIYETLVACDIGNVEKYPRPDPMPPVTMINNPRIDFPDNSFVGIAEWSIWMFEARKAPAGTGEILDVNLPKVLLALSHGIGIGFVIERVENTVRTIEGYPLPGYTIIGSAALPNC